MNIQKLDLLRKKVEEAEKLLDSIGRIDSIINSMGAHSKCSLIRYQCEEEIHVSHGPFRQDEEEYETRYIDIDITNETLGISEKEYSKWFTKPIVNYLNNIRNDIQKLYDELQ